MTLPAYDTGVMLKSDKRDVFVKLTTIEQVQQRVGKLPAPRDLKVIDYIDEHAKRWLSYARFAFVVFGKAGQIELAAAGGAEGFISASDPKHLQVP